MVNFWTGFEKQAGAAFNTKYVRKVWKKKKKTDPKPKPKYKDFFSHVPGWESIKG